MAKTVVIEDMDALLAKLTKLQTLQAVQGAMLLAGAHIEGKMKAYPPQSGATRKSVYNKTFKTDKQRRFFFYALKKGIIQLPYRRKLGGGLAGAWTVRAFDQGLSVEIGNNTSYGPLVQGQGRQSLYHKAGGWATDEAVLERETPAVVAYVKDAIEQALSE